MSGTARLLSPGDRLGNYQIVGKAGAGGMGVVYQALDLKLERTVALKFLPDDPSVSEKDKERFLREAKTASSLDHPNIGVIHGIEQDSSGRLFIVMAFYDGETLAERIRRGPLPLREAVEIAVQIARGLAEAHARGIVHRDIKPSNVILTAQGVAKIVDFGLARAFSASSAAQTQGLTGTASYMAPEQALGNPADPRADAWALGVVLAEMLTGTNPFQRETVPAILFAILNQAPAPLGNIPIELQKIIYRALAKDPALRYANGREMLDDLEAFRGTLSPAAASRAADSSAPTASLLPAEFQQYVQRASTATWLPGKAGRRVWAWLAGAAGTLVVLAALAFAIPGVRVRIEGFFTGTTEKHIAVLPFDNIGNNPANSAVAEGLMDSLSAALSNLDVGSQSLWVVPASVVRARKVDDPTAALRELGATLVVKGSIERDGQDVRLTVNLINTKTLRQIGSAELEDRAGNLATLQNEAVSRLANLMGIAVTPAMLKATGGKLNPVAYESYLKALGYVQRYDKPGNLDLAVSALNVAVKTDPGFALGYAELGQAYWLKYSVGRDPQWIDEVTANCNRALQLDNHLPGVYVTLAMLHSNLGNANLALQEFQQALRIDPHDADALLGIARAYERMGRIADSEAALKRSLALRPDYWESYNELGLFYDRQGKYLEALAQFGRAIELTPDNPVARLNLAKAYLDSGDPKMFPQAEEALKKSVELSPSYAAYANLGFLYLQEKRYADSAAMTEKALALNDKNYIVWENLELARGWLKQTAEVSYAAGRELKLLEETVKLDPQNAVAHSALAVLYAEKGLREPAMTQMQQALALSPDDATVLTNAGETYEDLGDRRLALQYVERGLLKGYPLEQLKNNPSAQGLLRDPHFRPNGK
jgi:eukaryotic-like serine/threonine-protein kinase